LGFELCSDLVSPLQSGCRDDSGHFEGEGRR
jgi:hypothetical protein